MNLVAGDRVDRYILAEPLGAGGQGSVWRADDPLHPGVQRAVKLVPSSSARPDQIERVRREARALAELEHPSLVRCHGLFEDLAHGVVGIVMDFVDGASLRSVIGDPRMTEAHATAALTHVARALAYLHEHGRVHRDLKGENVVVSDGFWEAPDAPGAVKLVDFGVASLEDNPDPLTMVGGVLGTVSHMAPELIDPKFFPAPPAKPTLDVFAFGVMGWMLLGGAHPSGLPRGSTVVDHAAHFRDAAEGRATWPAGSVSGPWEGLLRACLALRASERPRTGADILERYRRDAGDVASSAEAPSGEPGSAGELRTGAAREATPLSAAPTVVDAGRVPTVTAVLEATATEAPTVLESVHVVSAPPANAAEHTRASSVARPNAPTGGARDPAADASGQGAAGVVLGLGALVGLGVAGYLLLPDGESADAPLPTVIRAPSAAAAAPPMDRPDEAPSPDGALARTFPGDCDMAKPICECCPSGRGCGPGACTEDLSAAGSWHLSVGHLRFDDEFDVAELSRPEVCVDSEFHREVCTPVRLGEDGGGAVAVDRRAVFIGPLATSHLRQGVLRVVVRDPTYSPVPLARGAIEPATTRLMLCRGLSAKLDGVVASLLFIVDPYGDGVGSDAERCDDEAFLGVPAE